MEESILTSIKKLLGIVEDYTQFDTDIIIHINSAISILTQLGVGSSDGFSITDKRATWRDFVGDSSISILSMSKTFIYMKVRLIFDPPQSSAAIESLKQLIDEMSFRITVAVETKNKEEEFPSWRSG